jgi:uncharacterized damage-inducible protein DinB
MSDLAITRPAAGEFAPYYATYINKVPDENVLDLLERQIEETCGLLAALDDSRAELSYAPGKWSVKDVIGHMADTERVMAYRALRIARGDTTPLPGFEQNDYVRAACFNAHKLQNLIDGFRAVRTATLSLLRSLDAGALDRRGVANGVTVSVRALVFIIAGHERHHREILQTRYLKDQATRTMP